MGKSSIMTFILISQNDILTRPRAHYKTSLCTNEGSFLPAAATSMPYANIIHVENSYIEREYVSNSISVTIYRNNNGGLNFDLYTP